MRVVAFRQFTFDAGHRVMGHENKCAHLHGHTYRVVAHARAARLDGLGRVIDFAAIKTRLAAWVEERWDHGFLLHEGDAEARAAVEAFRARPGEPQKVYLLPCNPTAENIARHLLEVVGPEVFAGTGVELCKVTVWETRNCAAEAEL